MSIPKRSEVPANLKWDLTRIFKSDADWEDEYTRLKKEIPVLSTLKENFVTSGTSLYNGITKILALSRRLEKVYSYATLASDVDTGNAHYLGYVAQVQGLASQFEAVTAFMNPAILSVSTAKLAAFKQEEPRLVNYNHLLDQITRMRPYTLSAKEEKLIADAGDALSASDNTYNVLTNSDMEYGYTQNDDGKWCSFLTAYILY